METRHAPRLRWILRVANFFLVYNGNTARLGSFDESDAVVIVRAYTRAKSHVQFINVVIGTTEDWNRRIAPYRASGSIEGAGAFELPAYLDTVCLRIQKNHRLFLPPPMRR